jgi:uncharacterized repeat protein (TIGR03803 family)
MLIGTPSSAQYTKLLDFVGATNGRAPSGTLISDGTFLYGMTLSGGANNLGTVFKILPDGTGYVNLLDFAGATNGRNPVGSLILEGGFLYGVTPSGGANNLGTVFKMMPNGTGYVKLLDFAGTTNGSNPNGSLISDGTFLYGMTGTGGTNNLGTIFKIMPDGTGYVKILDFTGATNGSGPYGSLISDGIFLYGMTYSGGANNLGTVFKIMPDGTGYVNLLDFAGATNGSYPRGSLISDGTFLYGMTYMGGTNSIGTIFKIKPDGTGYVKLLDFAGGPTKGSFPRGSLISDGTFLYGMAQQSGTNNLGTVFKIKPDGTSFVKLLDFVGATNGSNPYGSLISDGTFLYGMTQQGGTSNFGVVFKLASTTVGINNYFSDIGFTIYPNPTTGIINISTSVNGVQFGSVTNILGELVLNKEINFVAGTPFTIDISNQPSGIYLLRVGNSIKRIIKQ